MIEPNTHRDEIRTPDHGKANGKGNVKRAH
jgi:hypothetical protein